MLISSIGSDRIVFVLWLDSASSKDIRGSMTMFYINLRLTYFRGKEELEGREGGRGRDASLMTAVCNKSQRTTTLCHQTRWLLLLMSLNQWSQSRVVFHKSFPTGSRLQHSCKQLGRSFFIFSFVHLTLWRSLLSYGYSIAIKHPVPDWVKPSFVIFDIRALWRSGLSVRVTRCQNYKWPLNSAQNAL